MSAYTGSAPYDCAGTSKTPDEYKAWLKERRQGNQGMTDAAELIRWMKSLKGHGYGFAGEAIELIDSLQAQIAAQPKYLTGCLRDGVCRGVCRNTDCPNHDMVVAARICVEPREDGIVYPAAEGKS